MQKLFITRKRGASRSEDISNRASFCTSWNKSYQVYILSISVLKNMVSLKSVLRKVLQNWLCHFQRSQTFTNNHQWVEIENSDNSIREWIYNLVPNSQSNFWVKFEWERVFPQNINSFWTRFLIYRIYGIFCVSNFVKTKKYQLRLFSWTWQPWALSRFSLSRLIKLLISAT